MISETKTNEINIKNKKFNFWQYFKPYKGLIFLMLLFEVWFMFSSVFTTLFSAHAIQDITYGLFLDAIRKFVIIACVQIINGIINFFYNRLWYKFQLKVTKAMSFDIVQQSFLISSKAYADHSTANFLKRIDTDPQTIFGALTSFVGHVASVITSVIVIGYIVYLNFIIGLVIVGLIVICGLIETYRKRKIKAMRKEYYKREEKYSSLLNESVRSEKDVKSLNLEKELKRSIEGSFDNYHNYRIKTNITNDRLYFLRQVIRDVLSCVALVLGVYFMSLTWLTLASFLIIQQNRSYIFNLITAYENLAGNIADIKLAVERISELYQDDEYEIEKFGKVKRNKIVGKIEFKNVAFSYTEYKQRGEKEIKAEKRANKRNKIKATVPTRVEIGKTQVFENLSFTIEPNTTVAFVGKSGSGKSTILNLISKMYLVDGGKITLDGVNINNLDKQTLRSSIALVNQFPYIFDMTIKENLLLAKPDATDEELNQVIKDSALDEFISTLTNGLDTRVGESGIKLSGGQKQRLAIARALLKKSSIILFDESTSSLDNLAQNHIKQSIDNIKGKSTIVIVAHRLTTIKNVDKIFYLEEGKIVDTGTFEELYKRNKNFKTMFLAENI